ncbi:glycosyltransferase family 2 protein [Shewanella sp. DC2-4]|uniref:glycosyltransferase family 2 protein n=1 Tax=Shewanella sp. DC2-4 TaxID=2739431 RepID=UPI001563BBFD|nr:glycosyltransferase family 2 protein [Shewanella sp. DC2-4]NRD31337.1 glycosyltransferase family 2 protein [Shewanella sp. DC2-4]
MKSNTICSVSVIIPFYNAGKTIDVALTSVFEQTLLPSEIIIVDDCSNENNAFLLNNLIEKINRCLSTAIPIKLVTLDFNRGASYARNIAITNAQCKYLAFLDSDDKWYKNKLKYQFEFMEENSLFMTGHGYIFDLNKSSFKEVPFSYSLVNRVQFIYTNPFFTPTVMVRRDSFKPFDCSFRRVDDYKCWIENYTPDSVAIIHNKLAGGFKHPIGSGGLTGSLSKMHDSYIEVLKSLYGEKKISLRFFYLARLVECVKYPLRIIRNKFKFLF